MRSRWARFFIWQFYRCFAIFVHVLVRTNNDNEGAELWRSNNGVTWDPVFIGGLGDPNNAGVWTFWDVVIGG
jgi:hypothetical protein